MPIVVAVIDVGYTNFALAIEKYQNKALKVLISKYNKLPKNDKIIERRPHTPVLSTILREFYQASETCLLELTDLNKGEKVGFCNQTRKNLDEYLKSKKKILQRCDYIIIERQFKTLGACNFSAILLGESTYSWMVFNLDVPVMYVPSHHKTCLLGCPRTVVSTLENGLRVAKDITKKDRKKWSTIKAIEILTSRQDNFHID